MHSENWIPVSSGIYPNDFENVQVTYLGCYDNKPYCDGFAFRVEGAWSWSITDSECEVEITAWKPNCEPYKEEREHG